MNQLAKNPIFFERNRVYRIYKGGKLFGHFFGDTDARDGNFPEEWIASATAARNEGPRVEKEGLSVVRGSGGVTFADLLRDCAAEMTGGRCFDVLVKALDAGIRLPAQVHPDRAFAREHFHSEHGKTEAWLVLAARPGAQIYFGFKEGVTPGDLARASEESETDRDAFLKILQAFPARVGEVWLIPGRAMHAIGEGCLLLEVQEPSDWVFVHERWCGDRHVSEDLMYFGLPPAITLECYDYRIAGPAAAERARKTPRILEKRPGYTREALIDYDDTPCFAINRHTVEGGECALRGPAVFVVLEGEGFLGEKNSPLRRGDYFFLPKAAGAAPARSASRLRIAECLPSRP